MTSKQRTWGQFATPIDVADLLLGFCLRRPNERVLDPSCGDGALLRRAARWRSWLAAGDSIQAAALYGIELDATAASVAATVPGAVVEQANFLSLDARAYDPFDVVIGNPPYTRAEWIDRLDTAAGQLSLFVDDAPGDEPAAPASFLPRELHDSLSGRAGLYAYFLIHSLGFLREGGRLGFVVPNGWLDVAYGAALKQFLLDHFRVIAVVESAVERWFAAARINTCLVMLERAGDPADRAANRVRFIRLRRPLHDLLGHPEDSRRVAATEQLVARLMPSADRHTADLSARVRDQASLSASERWGAFLRAPEVFLHHPARHVAPLGEWAIVQRGYTTGANDFFYLNRRQAEQWGIEPRFRRPLLKSLRGARGYHLSDADCRHEVLLIPPDAELAGTAAAEYLAWGESRGIPARPTCAARRPWYALPAQLSAGLFLAKGVWQRHFATVATDTLAIDQQIYRVVAASAVAASAVAASAIAVPAVDSDAAAETALTPSPSVAAALLNSAWFALSCELGGRVNLGEGVLWLASYDLTELMLPDPRVLDAGQRLALETAFARLAEQPLDTTPEALDRPEQRALDELVFDMVGLSATERAAARAALLECLDGRRLRARKPDDRGGPE